MLSLRGQRQQAQLAASPLSSGLPQGLALEDSLPHKPTETGDTCVSRCCPAEVCCPTGSLPGLMLAPRALRFMLWNSCFPSWPSCSQTLWSWMLNGDV